MKKLIILIFFLYSSMAHSQEHTKPIVFDNITPIWQHAVIDSSRLSDTLINGTNHLSNWGKNIFLGDSIAYFVYVDKSEDAQGGYIEKIDLKSGELLWSNVFNIKNSGKREYPAYVYINDSGNLEILCFRNIQESFILFWSLAQLSIREYSSSFGHLMRHVFQDQPILDDEELIFYPEKAYLYPTSDGNYAYYLAQTEENKYLYQLKRFDSDANFINIDTVSKKRKYCCYTYQSIIKIGKDSILTGRHQHKQSLLEPLKKENFDTFEFVVDLYSSNFDSITSYDLVENIPYYWSFGIGYDAGYIVVTSKDSIKTNNTKRAISYFNMDGTHYETIDFGKHNYVNLMVRILPNGKGVLMANKIRDINFDNERKIEIRKSDGNGNIKLLKTITFEGGRDVSINSLDILKNSNIILGLGLRKPDPKDPSKSTTITQYIVAFDGNELGLVGTQNEIVEKECLFIYPSPTNDNITIEFTLDFNGTIEINDALGRKIKTYKVENSRKKKVNISGLASGLYYVKAIDKDQKIVFRSESFVVE